VGLEWGSFLGGGTGCAQLLAVTAERFWLATILFHLAMAPLWWRVAHVWRKPILQAAPTARWLGTLARRLAVLALLTGGVSVLATVAANFDDVGRLHLARISERLIAQALFGEAIAFFGVLAFWHALAARRRRALVLGVAAATLLATAVDAYYVEPSMLVLRRHVVDHSEAGHESETLRILHVSDIQTPTIGPREEFTLRRGLESHPDMIVLTGDYVQDDLGRPTEKQAAAQLRELIQGLPFAAPLGVFATDGDTGPACGDVFAGTWVRCLVDQSTRIRLRSGDTLGITGLSRHHGRENDPAWLTWLLARSPRADHRLVISHSPDFVDSLAAPVDLVLAGHTHGGQVVIPFLGPPRTASRLPRLYAGGLHDYRGTPLHVSRGVGMERGFAVPVRFLCPPEICVLDVRFQRSRSRRALSW
jgi:predicted MPP superfamily phosphohydrolase